MSTLTEIMDMPADEPIVFEGERVSEVLELFGIPVDHGFTKIVVSPVKDLYGPLVRGRAWHYEGNGCEIPAEL